MAKSKTSGKSDNSGGLPLEAEQFKAADKLRGSMESSDYDRVALDLVFLMSISDAFEPRHQALLTENPVEDKNEYLPSRHPVPQTHLWGLRVRDAERLCS